MGRTVFLNLTDFDYSTCLVLNIKEGLTEFDSSVIIQPRYDLKTEPRRLGPGPRLAGFFSQRTLTIRVW